MLLSVFRNLQKGFITKKIIRNISSMSAENLIKTKNVPVIYYDNISPPARFVLMTVKALNLEIDYRKIDLFSQDHYTSEFKKINPLRTVPTLVDDDTIITDSHAISTYLANMYAPESSLYPKDHKMRSQVDRILYFNSGMLFPKGSKLMQNLLNPNHRDIPFSKIVAEYELSLSYLDKLCEKSKWLAGDSITLADLCCIATYSTTEILQLPYETDYPNVKKWAKLCKSESVYELANSPGLLNLKNKLLQYGKYEHIDKRSYYDTIYFLLKESSNK